MGFGFWVLGFGFWVLGFGFWVLGFGFWVLGFGFRVWGFGVGGLRLRPCSRVLRFENEANSSMHKVRGLRVSESGVGGSKVRGWELWVLAT